MESAREIILSNGFVMKKFLALALFTFNVAAFAADATAASKIFDVREFGAKGDGATFDTAAIQKALDECGKAGGTVHFSAGTYLSKPLTLRNRTTIALDVGATLVASPQPSDFLKDGGDWLKAKSSGEFTPFISGRNLTDVAIIGDGSIDGNGQVWWDEAEKARQKVSGFTLPRPNLISFVRCKNLRIAGVRLLNSPKFHLVPTECEDMTIDSITILSPERAANTDGIDPSNCRNVKITRCTIDTGDDNIAIKSGRKIEGREFGCENIFVSGCTFKHGHGMSIGSEVVGGVRNVTVTNCTFENTDNGLRIKSRRGRGGIVENITYRDIKMSNVHPAISIVAYYQNSTRDKYPKDDKPQPMTDRTPVFRTIQIVNVTASSTSDAGLIVGLPESPVQNIRLENVSLTGQEGLIIANAKGVLLNRVQLSVAHGEPIIKDNADVQFTHNEK
jgi:polygalacturonase